MNYETKDNTGTLFKNNRKEKDTHPDYNGSARIDGHDYWISAWLKDGKNGKFFSFAFKRKDGQPAPKGEQDYSQSAFAKTEKAQQKDAFGLNPLDDPEIPF